MGRSELGTSWQFTRNLPVSIRAPQSKQAIQLLTISPDFGLRCGDIQPGTAVARLLLSKRQICDISSFMLSLG